MLKLDLTGAWHVKQAGTDDAFSATVPGCVHTDLLAADRIDDPFFRDNEDHLRWIGEAEWVYSRTFEVTEEMLASERLVLRCEGLDTLATVSVNGQVVGTADNMFRTWEFDIRGALTTGGNSIEVRFASPLPVIEQRQAEGSAKSPATLAGTGDRSSPPAASGRTSRSWPGTRRGSRMCRSCRITVRRAA